MQSKYYNQSIKRAVEIMHLFTVKENCLGISEISRKIGLHKSTVHRILVTLESEGWLVKDEESGKYMLGLRLLSLSNAILENLNLRKIVKPVMKKLSKNTGETVVLAIANNSGAMCVEKVESFHSVKITSQVGKYFPLYAGATGLAILLGMPEEKIWKILQSADLKQYTDKTISDAAKIMNRVKKLKKQGYVVTRGEVDPGVIAVGMPIHIEYRDIYGSLSVVGPEYRFDNEKIIFTIEEMKKALKEIFEKVGKEVY